MRLFDIFSRHPRGDISAHADGELAPGRRDALEAHLAGCERCRTELDEILAVRSALQDLPQVAAPRSFTLTPAMAERERAPVMSRTTPSFVAMRVAGAGFAAVLAVVVMLDAGGIVDDPGGSRSDESSTALFDADPTNRGTEDDARSELGLDTLPEATNIPAASPDNFSGGQDADGEEGVPTAGGTGGGVGGVGEAPDGDGGFPAAGGIGGPDGSEDAPDGGDADLGLAPLPDDDGQEPLSAPNTSGDLNEIDGDDKAAAPESGDDAAAAFTSEDDGISYLLVIEIGLAAIAVLAIGGSFVIRRRAESE